MRIGLIIKRIIFIVVKFLFRKKVNNVSLIKKPNKIARDKILEFEDKLSEMPGAMFGDAYPLKHTFVDGAYVRQITMPKGLLVTSKIHKICHPYFILKGDVSVLTEEGVVRLKAPYSGITPAGTKRVLYCHEETVWTTVHVTKETDLKKIEKEIIAKNFAEIDKIEMSNFIKEVTEKEVLQVEEIR